MEFLVNLWGGMPSKLIVDFLGLPLAKSAYAICFNETGSTKLAQSYHCHKVEGLPFEPNVPPELSQGGGRARNEHQQGEDSKMRVGGEENPKGQTFEETFLSFPSSLSFSFCVRVCAFS